MYTFKAECVSNSQSAEGSHVATFEGKDGQKASIPSTDMLFVVGNEYSISVDGKFAPAGAKADGKQAREVKNG